MIFILTCKLYIFSFTKVWLKKLQYKIFEYDIKYDRTLIAVFNRYNLKTLKIMDFLLMYEILCQYISEYKSFMSKTIMIK